MNFQERLDSKSHDELRMELRTRHGIGKSDIVLLVGARIAPNKQTELAGRLTAVLSAKGEQLHGKQLYNGEIFRADSRIILVLAGRGERAFAGYRSRLFDFLNSLALHWQYVGDSVLPMRSQVEGCYALYPDMYTMADFVLYPSGWEGFGNQLLEAFAAGVPVVVFEYPVFQEDIAPTGVDVISLGDKVLPQDDNGLVRVPDEILERAARRMIPLLTNRAQREAVTRHNLEIGKRCFDFSVLRDHLAEGVQWAQLRVDENSLGHT